ncbi:MAG: hypothetical protein QF412_06170 [Planctomycetota bacterium]|nr:hypothetical protein [Planctomycetota bacterium]
MLNNPSVRISLSAASVLITLALVTAPSRAQTCSTGQLIKNDILPDVPKGPVRFGIVKGVCTNDAIMSVFDTGGAVQVHEVAVMFANASSTQGVKAVVDLEIYDGITSSPRGQYTMGKLVYKSSKHGGGNLQIQSQGINNYKLPTPVRVTSGKLVIGYRLVQNTSAGNCTIGYSTSFCVDANPTTPCPRDINVIDDPTNNHRYFDPMVYMGYGRALCNHPIRIIQGSWIIRACIKPEVSVTWSGNATPGGFVSLKFIAPGNAGNDYIALVGGAAKRSQTPWGSIPLDPNDQLFLCFLDACRSSMLLGGIGKIDASGNAFGAIRIPNLPVLRNSGLTMRAMFVTYKAPIFAPWIAVSGASKPIVIN